MADLITTESTEYDKLFAGLNRDERWRDARNISS